MAGIDVGLGDRWVAEQVIVCAGGQRRPLAGVQVPSAAFGSVMVDVASVDVAVFVATIV